jgi:tellurite methyltransferase
MSDRVADMNPILDQFGRIDIYLFDQLMRGRITSDMRVLDAGCGRGRNVEYLLKIGTDIYGVDRDPAQIEHVRELAERAAHDVPPTHFEVAELRSLPFPDEHFDAVICNAVLHFSQDEVEFESSVAELVRVLRAGGVLFTRLASTIGLETHVSHMGGRWYALPDGSDRFLVDEAYLLQITAAVGGTLLDPLKTTNVQNLRAMTTWVFRSDKNQPTTAHP